MGLSVSEWLVLNYSNGLGMQGIYLHFLVLCAKVYMSEVVKIEG